MNAKKIVEILKQEIQKENDNNKNNENKHSLLQIKARKLLIGFFIMMVILTVLSRVADSITLAQVMTQSPKGSVLTFHASGSGTITGDAKKYVTVQEGLGIDKINVEVGEEVKKGDAVLTVNQKDMENLLAAAQTEAGKLENQMKQEQDTLINSSLSTGEKAKILYESAKMDLSNAKDDLVDAKKNYQQAVRKKKEKENNYKQAYSKNTDEIYKAKKAEYEGAKANYSNVALSNDESLRTAQQGMEDAKNYLEDLQDKDNRILSNLEQYCNYYDTDQKRSKEGLEGVFVIAYGDDQDSYEKHKDQVAVLETKLARANDDLYTIQDYKAAKRAADDAKADLTAATKKEMTITSEANHYRTAKSNKNETDKANALLNINQCIYGKSGYEKHKNELTKADEKLVQTTTTFNLVKNKNELSLQAEQDKVNNLKDVIDSIKDGTYDFEEAVVTQEQAVETADQEIQTNQQEVKKAKRAIATAKQALLTAQLDYQQAMQQDGKSRDSAAKQEDAMKLRMKSIQLDLELKKKTIDELKELKKNKGKVRAPESGIVDNITFEIGKKAIPDNTISINTGKCGICAIVPKEEGEYVSIGDEMVLTAKGKKDKIKVAVEGIRFTTDKDGNEQTEITAFMPDDGYIPGATMDAEITKNSDLYDMCIPITGVREDEKGSYCLITQSRDTILGKELQAVRVNLTVTEKDNTMAAIESNLTNEDNVIISSNKNISEGDRVRIKQ
jgi:hypothetical protein